MRSFGHRLWPRRAPPICWRLHDLGRRPEVHGILVQLPLPPHLNPRQVIESLAPEKDVDGLHPVNQAAPGRRARPAPVYPARRHAAHRRDRRAGEGRPRRRRRPERPRRQAGRAAPARAARDRDGLPLAHGDLAGEVARADIVVAATGQADWYAARGFGRARS
jgi:methylenetetrahydrofolate dehydrogenase (NADP+)/methenyltetrahydrofolate cyclohydrolase